MSQSKYYVVWVGHSPGIYASWAECRRQVQNYPQAKYKGFASQQEAAAAFREGYAAYYAGSARRRAASRSLRVPTGYSTRWRSMPRASAIPG